MKHVSQLKEVQEFAMDIIKDYPLDSWLDSYALVAYIND